MLVTRKLKFGIFEVLSIQAKTYTYIIGKANALNKIQHKQNTNTAIIKYIIVCYQTVP